MATFSLALRHHQENVRVAKIMAQLALEADDGVSLGKSNPSRLPGDSAALRGLPAVGVRGGFGGAIAGTRPGANLR